MGLFLLGWDEEADVKFGGRWPCFLWYRQRWHPALVVDDPVGLRMKRCRYLGGRHTINLKNNGRSEKLQIYLNGDKSMAVMRRGVEVLSRSVPPPGIGDVGFDSSPNLAMKHTPSMSCAYRQTFFGC